MKHILFVVIVLFLSFSALAAETASCAQLVTQCRAAKKFLEHGQPTTEEWPGVFQCPNYLTGFAEALASIEDQQRVCLHDDTYPDQLVFEFISWVDQHPDLMQSDKAHCVTAAFAAHPCPATILLNKAKSRQ